MQKFPDPVITAMHHAATTVTCLPVTMDEVTMDGDSPAEPEWRSAIFFVLPETIDEEQCQAIFKTGKLFPVGLDADLKEQEGATLILMGVEIDIGQANPLRGEILFLTGHLDAHFETVDLISKQESIDLFIGDKYCTLLHQQSIPLAEEHRAVFTQLLKEASSRDALIRFRGQYDPDTAFAELTGGGSYDSSPDGSGGATH